MSDQERRRKLTRSLETALADQAAAERYRRYQQRIRRGRTDAAERPRPTEFDERGFPLPQRNSSFIERVARLMNTL
ncbi:MAG: hypothetical protein LC790_05770 [Actinobacteria bacterium]|nr:hypothetical protein [Actinomycetota bacterium]